MGEGMGIVDRGIGIGREASGGGVSVFVRVSEPAEARSMSEERRIETLSSMPDDDEDELEDRSELRPVALAAKRRRPLAQRCVSSSACVVRPVAMYSSCNLENVRLKSWLSRPRNASRISSARLRLCSALSKWPCSVYKRPKLCRF